jgi:hypothetical protein
VFIAVDSSEEEVTGTEVKEGNPLGFIELRARKVTQVDARGLLGEHREPGAVDPGMTCSTAAIRDSDVRERR